MTEDETPPACIEASPRVAAYVQLVEISAAVSEGRLDGASADALYDELEMYLGLEIDRFADYPRFDWPAYTEGLARVREGLETLLRVTRSSRLSGLDEGLQAQAEQGSDAVVAGQALLVDAHTRAVEG